MSFSCDTILPLRLDLTPLECRQILREKELLCYSDVVSVLRAQGPLSEEKKSVLNNLQKIFSISDERNKAEFRRAANNEKLATIAEAVSGFDAYAEWASLGAQKIPPTRRPIPRTVFCDEASQTFSDKYEEEKLLPLPIASSDSDLCEKIEESIARNRFIKKETCPTTTCSIAINTDSVKSTPKKEGVVSLEYNLHLLSEIATGESTQSGSATETSDIKPDLFSIHNQIDDIELPISLSEQPAAVPSRYPMNSHISTPANILMSSNAKNMGTIGHDSNSSNLSASSAPMIIGNNPTGQRYVLPRNAMSQGISLIASNPHRHQGPGYITQQQQHQQTPALSQPGTYLTMANTQMRSPPSHHIGTAWTGQPQTQQVYIQNVSTHHGLGGQHNLGHQPMENLTSLGYTLQQRAVRAEQHQTNNKQNLIVRNLGSQPSVDPERNKRFMVVKGGSSLGPTTKKPKISNPSNRQPGRPPLMPAPSSAYTSRPYVANEIFHSSRTTSSMADSSSVTDSNGLKISSVISSGTNSNSSSMTAGQVRTNSYYNMNRGNGSTKPVAGSIVQLGSGTQFRAADSAGISTNALRPKNIQPIISVVPLSPRGQTLGDNITASNVSLSTASLKEENIEHHNVTKESTVPVKIINKSEMYANLMDRINSPARVPLNQTENKTQQHDLNISDIS